MNQSSKIYQSNNSQSQNFNAALRVFAKIFSYLFHPLFIPLYVMYYLVFINYSFFAGINNSDKTWILIRVALNMVFFPLLSVVLLKAVGFIDSFFLKTQKDRIIPYMTSGIFFFWMYLVFRNHAGLPQIVTAFVLGVFLTSSVGLIANIYYKISMHAMGCGGMLGIMLVVLRTGSYYPFSFPFIIFVLITGFVCTSRLIISDHTQKEIYTGLLFGLICQFISAAFIL